MQEQQRIYPNKSVNLPALTDPLMLCKIWRWWSLTGHKCSLLKKPCLQSCNQRLQCEMKQSWNWCRYLNTIFGWFWDLEQMRHASHQGRVAVWVSQPFKRSISTHSIELLLTETNPRKKCCGTKYLAHIDEIIWDRWQRPASNSGLGADLDILENDIYLRQGDLSPA